MSDTLPNGKVRRPVPAAWDAPGYFTKAMLGVGLGVALYAGALVCVWLLAWQASPPLLTPLFAVPLAVALFGLGRIGIVGALVIAAGTTAAHFAALFAAAYVYDGTPVFATPAQRAADAVRAQLNGLLCGAVGGAVGAALSFGLIATLAPGLRDRQRLSEYAFATLALTALGAAGLGSLLSSGHGGLEPPGIIFLLYIPWQAAFGYAIVSACKDHQAVRYKRAPG